MEAISAADVAARFKRLEGYKVFFLTGTDEHGQKVQQAAKDLNVTPQHHVDKLHQQFKELWVKKASNSVFYKDFSPPDLPKDFQVLHQTFLI